MTRGWGGAMSDLLGFDVIETPLLPMDSTPAQDARRIVRHGMADVLSWLGEDVGPKPGDQTNMLLMGRTLMASASVVGTLRGLSDA